LFFSQFNHNSSSYSNYLFRMLFILRFTFIYFIWNWFQITRIKSKAFANSSLKSITIPRHVHVLSSRIQCNLP
jgi:hypothetical protein